MRNHEREREGETIESKVREWMRGNQNGREKRVRACVSLFASEREREWERKRGERE